MKVPLTHIRFLERARTQFGEKIGVVDGDRSWTYRQYDRRCRQMAHLLKSWELPERSPVAFISYNTHHLLEAYYGVPLAGHILLPLNIRLTSEDFLFILNDCRASALFLHADFLSEITVIQEDLPHLRRIVLLDEVPQAGGRIEALPFEDLLEGRPDDLEFDIMSVDEDSVSELFYTSGTTGHPKGVMLTHRNLYLHALEACLAMEGSEDDVQLHSIPLFHVNGWGTPQFLTCLGGRHVMLPRFEAVEVFGVIERERVNVMSLVPTMAVTLVNHPGWTDYDLSSMRMVVVGGAANNAALVKRLEEVFGCRCFSGYGMTETSPVLTLARPRSDHGLDAEALAQLKSKTGYPVPGVELQIWDEQGRPLPWDGRSRGEIVVRGDMIMTGYLNREDENRQAFAGGWFHTGDTAIVDPDGCVTIVDRKKDIIISGGENISSLEVERVLMGHPAVLECAVIAVPDPEWGEVPRALVVLKQGRQADSRQLIQFLRDRLAHFKCPRQVDFCGEFPKGGTGKILKRQLRQKYWDSQAKQVN